MLDLSGVWHCAFAGQTADVRLPGTLDENGLGFPDDPSRQWKVEEVRRIGFWKEGDPIVTRLTRLHVFEGEAVFSRALAWTPPEGQRVLLEAERARPLRALVNGREAERLSGSLSTPWVFDLTGMLTGRDQLSLVCDNRYSGLPREDIVYSSAASDETQTNWNGVLGFLRLRTEALRAVSGVRVYPRGDSLDVCVELCLASPWSGRVRVDSPALCSPAEAEVRAGAGLEERWFRGLPVRPDAPRWDLEEGRLLTLTVSAPDLGEKTVRFGLRDLRAENGRLCLNGRPFFLRGEANCCVFPETGHAPTDPESWRRILQTYRDYGVNCVRFHSHCPPEAAFEAADGMGMLLQPELSHWNPSAAFHTPEAREGYRGETRAILRCLANHPSFGMLTFGNELQADVEGLAFAHGLLREARELDPTRLYAFSSNPFYGQRGTDPESDFFTASDWRDQPLRLTSAGPTGWLNRAAPDFRRTFAGAVAGVRGEGGQPVFSFEVGQYESLPDFGQIGAYRGVTRAENLAHMRRKAEAAGLLPDWDRRVRATGELALRCYRAEAEAAMRTPGLSGISLLGLQDFPGQGTALVGMLDAHLRPKPFFFARPERFRAFFRDRLPLALLPRLTFTAGETLSAELLFANFGKTPLRGSPAWTLTGPGLALSGALPPVEAPCGGLTPLGTLRAGLPGSPEPLRLCLTLSFAGETNAYDLWLYPDAEPVCPPDVYECRALDDRARACLAAGGRVFLAPDSTPEALPGSVQAQFSTDFWSVCTFPDQSGCMGQLIEKDHPALRLFPTEEHTDWQWWPMAGQRAIPLPEGAKSIVTVLDSCAFLRPLTQLCETSALGGRLLISTFGLHRLGQYPEARALLRSIYAYLGSP